MTWEPRTFRGQWSDDLRLRLDGVDVTYFRGAPVQLNGYQLQEPFAYGPADFAFPQVTQHEVHRFGTGALKWLRHGARAELVPVTNGAYGERIWAGVVTSLQVNADGVAVHCDGELSGRLAVQDKQPPVFIWKKDLGLQVFDSVLHAGISLSPYLGPKTGIRTFASGGGSDLLSFVNDLLAQALTDDGEQWTVARKPTGRGYTMRLKDTTTVHATVFLGAHGVELDVTRDVAEEPTTLWGTGTQPDGVKITNAVMPNLFATEPATYPYTDGRSFGEGTRDEDTDTGAGVWDMQRKLVGMGFMSRAEAVEHVWEDDTTDAVKALQRRAGLPRTGVMNPATWRALFNEHVTGRTLYGARVLPMADSPETRRFNLTSNGSYDTANPDYDPKVMRVDQTIDHGGGVWKREMLAWSARYLDRIRAEPNWVGTLNLNGADLFAGDVDSDTEAPTPMGRLNLREGHNVKVVGFNGTTLFHVSGINVDTDRNLSCAVDTRSRDLLTVGQIIARNKESRRSAAREFLTSVRRPNAMDEQVVSNELFGEVDAYRLKAHRWNRIAVPCGQSGSIDRVRVHLRDSRAAFVMGVSVKSIASGRMNAIAGANPLKAGSKWAKGHVQHRLKNDYLFLYTAGQRSQPLGYYPLAHTGDDNKPTLSAITGDWEDDAGFAFRTFTEDRVGGVMYLYIFPDRACTLTQGKVFYVNESEGA